MKSLALAAASAILLGLTGSAAQFGPAHLKPVPQPTPRAEQPRASYVHIETHPSRYAIAPEALTEVVHRVCGMCHNDAAKIGNLSLEKFDVAQANREAETAEKMIRKLRAGMMPPPGIPRPGGDTMKVLVETLERIVDAAAAAAPEPGSRTFQRLNRTEYARAVKNLLTLEVDAGSWLPLDTKSANFDNIADVQIPSATLLDSYLDAASEIARLAVGDANASRTSTTYKIPRLQSQWDQVEGAPMGTRGGVSALHTFPADGEYVFLVTLHAIPTGQLFGSDAPFDEKIEISVDGARVGLIDVDRWMSQSDAQGMDLKTPPVPVRAGAHRITAAFLRTFEGPVNDNIASIGHSIADTQIGSEQGITNVAHLREFTVTGPYNPTGVSETASRRKIFTCRPTKADEERTCAEKIVTQLGSAAYRRPLNVGDTKGLMKFYEEGAKEGGFEIGVRTALEAILASPHFIFRLEEIQGGARSGSRSAINDFDLASRLSFFIWGTPPDDQLLSLARRGALADVTVLQAQAKRMLADPRSEALATRFAAQWLRLQDIEKNHPDALQFPDFHAKLAADMQRETELFFNSIVRDDKSVLDLFRADYTYLNDELAKHYGIKGVTGPEFRRVQYPNDTRRGLLGHASILTLTSHANRTSPVLRGKWVMEVLLGTPPPPPPPGVPDLEKTKEAEAGRMLTTRERMELHRSNEVCRSCHQFMDPIGLALDNFDVTGQWRIRENGIPLDTKGTFYDGTDISNPAELQGVLLKRPLPLIRNFTQNLMAYGLGRRVEYYDQPVVRSIAREAAASNYKFSDFVLGIVKSDAFRMKRVPAAADDNASGASSARQP